MKCLEIRIGGVLLVIISSILFLLHLIFCRQERLIRYITAPVIIVFSFPYISSFELFRLINMNNIVFFTLLSYIYILVVFKIYNPDLSIIEIVKCFLSGNNLSNLEILYITYEEYLFRMILITILSNLNFSSLAICIIGSIAFTIVHKFERLNNMLEFSFFSFYITYVFMYTRNIFLCIVIHYLRNNTISYLSKFEVKGD